MQNKSECLNFLFPMSKGRVASFLHDFPDGVIFSDKSGSILYSNNEMENIFGYSNYELLGMTIESVIPSELQKYSYDGSEKQFYFKDSLAEGHHIESKGLHKDGSLVPIEMSHRLINDNYNQLNFSLIRNISHQFAQQEKLYLQSITDSLTGLFNRRYFDEQISQEFHRASRYQRIFSVMIIDIDGFKQANDLFGHSYGDEMLGRASDIFREVFRDGDSVYRYGGDEFAIILPETTKEGALDLSKRLGTIFAKKCCDKEKRISLTLSIGIGSHPEDGGNEVDLIKLADRRMYQSKEIGGNIVTAYNLREPDEHNDDEDFDLLLTRLNHMVERNRHWESPKGVSHSQKIRALGVEIGRKLDLSPDRLRLYEHAAMLHDIDTFHIPKSIFHKKDKLTEEEVKEIRRHTDVGEEILSSMNADYNQDLAVLKTIVSQHHEWIDGNGYPRGLKGDEILIEARLLAVTDAYSAMKLPRSYRPALSEEEIVAELKRMAGKQFDSEIIDVFLGLLAHNGE